MNYLYLFLFLLIFLMIIIMIQSKNNSNIKSNDLNRFMIDSDKIINILYSDKLTPLVKPQDKYYWGLYLVITPNSESVEKGRLMMFSEPKDSCGEYEEKQYDNLDKKMIIWMFCNDSKDKHLIPGFKDTYYWTFCMCDEFGEAADFFIDPIILQIGEEISEEEVKKGSLEKLDTMYFIDDGERIRGVGKYGSTKDLIEYTIYKKSFPLDIAKDVIGINKPHFLIAQKDNKFYSIETIRLIIKNK